ncbi:MAG: DNA polymerase III subunits gamma and tau [uncultured Rubrobacteraceae bacterium]|uniref:DNA polymerase III subunit gamma/tau n=1 Tax=uncultured Rubrobacteraceae bacterium TaxID=349277 RepID=A0A6J4QTF0_9ACTN|nr:MAG: DNA polymerase III subunits gamma and tau [uncultured Rubrobacteraceae bacterium]
MRHVSLYRKWRPRTFDAVAGQEPVVRTLRRAIETGRVAHAYLFSGPRGTGKTSTAKVLAMGLNCEKGPTPEPDGTCESCRAIVNNSSMDVLEMDAASNRGIDEIRDLRDRVNLAPVGGRMKVYIIDEVHMLTTEAFNALLKMLEEPPEHVVFVLATTEKHKVLPTIISRCQSFDFRRPGVALLSEKLREIADAEEIETEPAALTLISREARGSFRDAEGLLDQLSSFSDGPITAAKVRELLGGTGSDVLLETTDALYERRAADALRVVDRLQNEGRDLSRFAGELIAHLRRLMLLPHAPEVALAEVGQEERAGLEEQASRIPTAEVVRVIEALGDAVARARRGGDPKLELELTFLKLARDYEEPQVDALLRRLEMLEKAVENGAVAAPRTDAEPSGPVVRAAPVVLAVESEEPAGEVEEGEPEEEVSAGPGGEDGQDGAGGIGAVAAQWGQVMRDLKDRKQALTATVFAEGQPATLDNGVLVVTFPEESDFYIKEAGKPRHSEALGEVLESRLGVRPRFEFRIGGNAVSASGTPSSGVPAPVESEAPKSRGREEAAPPPAPTAPPPEPELEARETTGMGGSEGDDLVRDSEEVFVMAREFFDLGNQNRGS